MKSQYCLLTGIDLTTDGPSNGFKTMCLNCKSCGLSDETWGSQKYSCSNEKVMEVGKNKILAALPEGFEIETLTLKPMALKDPTKKCKNYSFDKEKVMEFIEDFFTPSPNAEKENASE